MTLHLTARRSAPRPLAAGLKRITAGATHGLSGAFLILGIASCASAPDSTELATDPRVDCPAADALPSLIQRVARVADQTGPQAFDARSSPMFHDCQSLQKPGQGNQPNFITVVHVLADVSVITRQDSDFQMGRAYRVAALAEMEGKAFPDLDLDRDEIKCLYLGTMNGMISDAASLRASIQPCTVPDTTLTPAMNFKIVRETAAGASFDDYPPVARFHWSTHGAGNAHRQAVGVKCGSGWCVVGKGDIQLESLPTGGDIRERIRGWHDRQRVAERPGGASWAVGPRATIIPYAQNSSLDQKEGFEQPGGMRVAKMVIDAFSLEYRNKFNLVDGDTTDVYIEHRPGDSVETGWKAILKRRATGATIERKVIYHAHGAQPVTTARWYWNLQDEHAWTRCPLGCCEITAAAPE